MHRIGIVTALFPLLLIPLLAGGCNSQNPATSARLNESGMLQESSFGLYLLAKDIPTNQIASVDLNTLELQDEPLISIDDIITYSQDTHEIQLTAEMMDRIASLRPPTSGTPFVVCAGGERIYWGAFWPGYSSQSFDGIVIDPIFASYKHSVQIQLGYPATGFYDGEDPRSDPRILDSLQKAKKLKFHYSYTGEFAPELPGTGIHDIAVDQKGDIFFLTSGQDTTVAIPIYSSFTPWRYYISRLTDNKFEIIDDSFRADTGGKTDKMPLKILFDYDNNLWIMTHTAIYRQSKGSDKTLEYSTGGLFKSIAIDSKNNVWVCGLGTGLIKIDAELNITRFCMTNSELPTNSMTSIHIDRSDNVWVSLWDNRGILKISGENWTIYNSGNSNITSQNIWCVMTDKFDNVWIGTGHDDPEVSLMKFDGTDWTVQNLRDDEGNVIRGTVRTLTSDSEKIWVVSSISEKMNFSRCFLTVFDGSKWTEIDEVNGEYVIPDIEFDASRDTASVGSWNPNKPLYMFHNQAYHMGRQTCQLGPHRP